MAFIAAILPRRYRIILERLLYYLFIFPIEVPFKALDVVISRLQNVIGLKRMAYFFIMPNMLIFSIFILLPMFLNFYYAFTTGSSILPEKREFVGEQNLDQIFECENYFDPNSCREDLFWRGARNTFFFVNVQVVSMVIWSLVTALALNRKLMLRGFFRSVFFYPVLLSPVVVALSWGWFLRYDNGLLNAFLQDIGADRIQFLTDITWARFWVILISDWAQMGFYTLILLAGLQAIPADLYESSAIDGANEWNRFRHITLPLLMPTMIVVVVLALIRAVQVFDQVFVLTGGGPGTSTMFMVQYIYRKGFGSIPPDFGMAAAASLILASVLLVMTLLQLFFARRQNVT